MILVVGTSILVIVITAVFWLSTFRPVDRVNLLLRTARKLGIRTLVLRRPTLHQLQLSNGQTLLMPRKFLKHSIDEVLKLQMRPDDVMVASYAKAGTTWMQEIVWLICNGGDTKAASKLGVLSRFGYVEALRGQGFGYGLQDMENWPIEEKRFLKTHLPFELLPNELQNSPIGKLIYVARNPKDNCVSLYHFHRMNVSGLPDPGKWSEFLNDFCKGNVIYGSWFDHVHKYWQIYQQREDSIHFVTYESLKKDLKREVTKLAKFLQKDLPEEKIDEIVRHCSFRSMSDNKNTNYSKVDKSGVMNFKVSTFMRKGIVGDWKNHFTINQNEAFDKMYEERTKDWALEFEFEPDNQ